MEHNKIPDYITFLHDMVNMTSMVITFVGMVWICRSLKAKKQLCWSIGINTSTSIRVGRRNSRQSDIRQANIRQLDIGQSGLRQSDIRQVFSYWSDWATESVIYVEMIASDKQHISKQLCRVAFNF